MDEGSRGVRSEALGAAFDLLGAYPGHGGFFLERDGAGVAASAGTEMTADTADEPSLRALADRALSALRSFDAGDLPVAVGAVGFDPRAGGSLQVPAAAVRRTDAAARRIEVDPGGTHGIDPLRTRGPRAAFAGAELREVPPVAAYEDAVRRAVAEIRGGALRKVVLARSIEVETGHDLDPRRLLHHLRAVEPHASCFAVPVGAGASLVGASPELLVSRRGREVRSNPLAGSAPRSGDPELDREHARVLEASSKDQEEHAIVVEAMAEVLGPFCEELRWDPRPVLRETANVWHLSTRFRGILREPAPSALELVGALHPTPAVCGDPGPRALDLIRELEPFDRGRYAGVVGWVDASGDGEWVIALRCAKLAGERATLYAGAGIVVDSDPPAEADETERKFRAFLDALRWG